jgi:competence protein ComEA
MGEWKTYFVYTKRERQAVIFLMVLIISMLAIPHLFKPPLVLEPGHLKDPLVTIERTEPEEEKQDFTRAVREEPDENKTGKLFDFNPNTAGLSELMRLGLTEKAATVIIHYREKGGKFKKAEDLSRIYSIRRDLYERLRPFVRIPPSSKPGEGYYRRDSLNYKPAFTNKEKLIRSIDINQSDQSEWESLPGIGTKLATRILTFRAKLGGFINAEQVKETYGITDSVFAIIRPMLQCQKASIRQFDINAITIEELKEHPYFRGKIAYAIIRYREQHGNFKSIEDLWKLQVIDEIIRIKIEPYILIKNS